MVLLVVVLFPQIRFSRDAVCALVGEACAMMSNYSVQGQLIHHESVGVLVSLHLGYNPATRHPCLGDATLNS